MSVGTVVDIVREPLLEKISKLEGDLSVCRLQLQRIAEQMEGTYGTGLSRMKADDVRTLVRNIAYIVNGN